MNVELGYVAVDSGMLRIIDPCYEPEETYNERLNHQLFPMPWLPGREGEIATVVTVKPMSAPLGLDITGWGGDGRFPVTAQVKDGMVTSITIHVG